MLELSHSYRKETERERKIMQQKADLHNLNKQLDQKIDRLERTLKEQQNAFHDVNPECTFFSFIHDFMNMLLIKCFYKYHLNYSYYSKARRGE